MKKNFAFAAVLLATLAFVATGCGGSDDEGPTKDEFIAQADKVCEEGNKAIQAKVADQFGDEQPSKKQITEFVTGTYVPEFQNQVDELREIEPPADDQETWDSLVDALQEGVDKIKEDPNQVLTGSPLQGAAEQAQEYGFKVCGAASA
ncbi:MAG: hypothetical protein M3Y45_06620 [Actinomycetota bacterium]|nr:hypothetical protein [Actinomycetota bacterium]